MTRWAGAAGLAAALLLLPASGASAHPLGNFTVNQYLGITVRPGGATVEYVVDMAEIPTFQELRRYEGDDPAGAYAETTCPELGAGLTVALDGVLLPLAAAGGRGELRPGQADLNTLRLECTYAVEWPADAAQRRLSVSTANYDERLGWREIVVRGDGVSVGAEAPQTDVSRRLEAYPEDLLQSPPDVRAASFEFVAVGEAAASTTTTTTTPAPSSAEAGRGFLRPPDAFSSLITRADLGPLALGGAFAVAFLLGAGHALAPGHGKTIMAAYLVGTRGTVRQAAGLALAVAVSHTLGVLALGVITVWATATWDPARVYPYLSLLAGLVVLGVGVALLVRWWRRRSGAAHDHGHSHGHGHDHGHTHAPPSGEVGWRSLVALGLSGGLVPSASAVVLLLGAVSLRRVPLGIVLIALFGLGMAVALVGVGLLLVYAGEWGLHRLRNARFGVALSRYVVPAMALLVVVLGAALTFDAVGKL